MTKTQQIALALAALLGLVALAPAFALAQTTIHPIAVPAGSAGADAGASVNAGASAGGTSASAGASTGASASAGTSVGASAGAAAAVHLTAAETRAQNRGVEELQRRIKLLNAVEARISNMQEVSASFKTALQQGVQAQITALTALQQQVQAASSSSLRADIRSVAQSYRLFALVMPQARISAAADRIVTIVTMMSQLGSKLQARVQASGAASSTQAALNATLAELSTNIQAAQAKAQTAVTAVISLKPDNGTAAAMASTTAALKGGRDDIVAAQKDLAAARKNIGTLISEIAKLPGPNQGAGAAATTSASASASGR